MRNFLWTLLIVGVFIAASLVSIDGANGAIRCRGYFTVGSIYAGTVTHSTRTSCTFTKNVVKVSLRYIVRSGGRGDGDFFVWVWSPITRRNYRMHCWANGDLSVVMHADCFGGNRARVIYNVWEQG